MANKVQIKQSEKGVVFDPPIHIRGAEEDDEVIVFGKSAEENEQDLAKGISRFGGWRSPHYASAYLRAARTLVTCGSEKNDLDNLGLPIFYLQRHTVELFIKQLLGWLYEIAEMRHRLYGDEGSKNRQPSKQALKDLEHSHDLKQLHEDLRDITLKNGFENGPKDVPEEIGQLVEFFGKYEEEHHTWSRYPYHKDRQGIQKSHVDQEVAVPVVEIQERLENMKKDIGYRMGAETFETLIYNEWNSLFMRLEATE